MGDQNSRTDGVGGSHGADLCSKIGLNSPNPPVHPAEPDEVWLASYLQPTLYTAKAYEIDIIDVPTKLDQNENPYDWPAEIKAKISERSLQQEWNRYPSAYHDDLAELVANYAKVAGGSVLLTPGSNYLCALVLGLFGRCLKGQVRIARPSFALYESHCRYEGLRYEPWILDDSLNYRLAALDSLPPGSLVMFASPNNPVGNVLRRDDLKKLLTQHPNSLFIADEAYYEYAEEPYTDLLADHSNLILLRTFSKTMGCANLRIGYAVAHPNYINQMRKVRLPFLINPLQAATIEVVIGCSEAQKHLENSIREAISERKRIYRKLHEIGVKKSFYVQPSEANFHLLKWPDQTTCDRIYKQLIDEGILLRNISAGPGLAGCLRASIGSVGENDALLNSLANL